MRRYIAVIPALLFVPAMADAGPSPKIPAQKSILLAQAIDAGRAAIAECATRKSPIIVEIVELDGLTKVLLSADGAQTNGLEYARRKAYTVLHKGASSGIYGRSLGKLPPNPYPLEGDPNLIEWAGALPIMRDGSMIGAISVAGPTGGDDDEACAQVGLNHIH